LPAGDQKMLIGQILRMLLISTLLKRSCAVPMAHLNSLLSIPLFCLVQLALSENHTSNFSFLSWSFKILWNIYQEFGPGLSHMEFAASFHHFLGICFMELIWKLEAYCYRVVPRLLYHMIICCLGLQGKKYELNGSLICWKRILWIICSNLGANS